MLRKVAGWMVVAAMLSGCGQQAAKPATSWPLPSAPPDARLQAAAPLPVGSSGQGDGNHAGESPSYQIVRYIGVDAGQWKGLKAPQNYSDFYTRIELDSDASYGVTKTDAVRSLRNYSAENRNWFSRLLSSRTDTVTTMANITVRDPALAVAVPLFSVTHASGLDLGNVWNTNYVASSVESPLFLIGPNTGVTIHLSAKVSSDLKSQGTSLAIGAISRAVNIAAPTSTLLTTLSSSDVSNVATAIDTAISGLLSADISEDIEVGRLADSWTVDSRIVLYGCAPFVRPGDATGSRQAVGCAPGKDIDGGADAPVGAWSLRLSCPRPSVFDPRSICEAAGTVPVTADNVADLSTPDKRKALQQAIADAVSDAQVLAFNLSSQVSVRSFIQSQSWFTAFAGATSKAKKDYDDFCSGGIVGLEASGLNQLDAALVMRAAFDQLPQLADSRVALSPDLDGKGCLSLLDAAGVSMPR